MSVGVSDYAEDTKFLFQYGSLTENTTQRIFVATLSDIALVHNKS